MDRFDVEPGMLNTAAYEWREQANAVDGAASAVAGASSSGVGAGVQADVTAFLTTWSEYATSQAELAVSMADRLEEAATAYMEYDYRVQDAFVAWLEGGR